MKKRHEALRDYALIKYIMKLSISEMERVLSIYGGLGSVEWSEVISKAAELALPPEKIRTLKSWSECQTEVGAFIQRIDASNIAFVLPTDDSFPKKLLEIEHIPPILFYQGDIDIFNRKKVVSIVGTRKPSAYGSRVTRELSAYLAAQDLVVVSGLALGIDGVAHQSVIDRQGVTAAVLATGIKQIYPKAHGELCQSLLKGGGVVISEKPLADRAFQYDFPYRNRLISGLADVVVIIEAAYKSGSLITAKYAAEQGKTVFALPGNIYSDVHKGTNQLIFDGATPLIEFQDVLEALAMQSINDFSQSERSWACLSEVEKQVLEIIKKYNIIELEALSEKSKLDLQSLNAVISRLMIDEFCQFSSLTEIQYLT